MKNESLNKEYHIYSVTLTEKILGNENWGMKKSKAKETDSKEKVGDKKPWEQKISLLKRPSSHTVSP